MSIAEPSDHVRAATTERLDSLAAAYDELVTAATAAITAAVGRLERADPDVRRWPADEQELQRRMDWPDFTSRNEAVAGLLVVKAARAALAAAGIHDPRRAGVAAAHRNPSVPHICLP